VASRQHEVVARVVRAGVRGRTRAAAPEHVSWRNLMPWVLGGPAPGKAHHRLQPVLALGFREGAQVAQAIAVVATTCVSPRAVAKRAQGRRSPSRGRRAKPAARRMARERSTARMSLGAPPARVGPPCGAARRHPWHRGRWSPARHDGGPRQWTGGRPPGAPSGWRRNGGTHAPHSRGSPRVRGAALGPPPGRPPARCADGRGP
jgi:hypothetical protein